MGREPQCLPRRRPKTVPHDREEGLGQNPEAQEGSRGSGGRAMSDGDGGQAQRGGRSGEASCEVREEDAMLVHEKQPLGHWKQSS